MSDLIYLAVIFAFFGICVQYVRACDRIIGPDEESGTDDLDAELVDLTEKEGSPS